jgi:hypothetical protein
MLQLLDSISGLARASFDDSLGQLLGEAALLKFDSLQMQSSNVASMSRFPQA